MRSQIASVTVWHINADEPEVLDYNTEFKTNDRYDVTPYRSSDHDPVLLGLNLNADPAISMPTLNAVLPSSAQASVSVSISSIVTSFINASGTATLSVDWGDASGPQALALNASGAAKTYANAGTYTISLLLTDGQGIGVQLSGEVIVAAAPGPGPGSELFFSEYVEGTSNNKALEIYNPSAAAIDLSVYKVKLYANGASVPTSTQILSGNVIDAIGQVGFDPGTAWTNGAVTTLNKTLRRKASINQGSVPPAAPAVWNPALEWDAYAVDTFNGLGLR
jgi:predicted extracellular nuclease